MRAIRRGCRGGPRWIGMTIKNTARFFQHSFSPIDRLWGSRPRHPQDPLHGIYKPFVPFVGNHVGINPLVEPVGPFRQPPRRPVAATPTFTNLRIQPTQPPIAGAIAILTRMFCKMAADLFQAVEGADPVSQPRFCELWKAEGRAKIRFAV
jgi:hypothetical protein